MEWMHWLQSPAGHYVLQWEQARFDMIVADAFGHQALQFGLSKLDGLRKNRILNQHILCESFRPVAPEPFSAETAQHSFLQTSFEALPITSESVDLVLLPHTLESAQNPYLVLSEVKRILRPEGKMVLSGFNPASLWGLRHGASLWLNHAWLPQEIHMISYTRLQTWLKNLGFEIDQGCFGCYRLASKQEKWLSYSAFMDYAGDRWWPVFGAVYLVAAVKRTISLRLIGPHWDVLPQSKLSNHTV